MDKNHHHGSKEVWDELFASRDLTYSEKADTQGKLFELIKVKFLEKLFNSRLANARSNSNTTAHRPPPVTSLEVGSGTAFVSLYFAKHNQFEATCLDSSAKVLKVVQRNFKTEGVNGKFVVGDALKLPFKDNSFDLVMSFGLLEHFSDPELVIKEMVRVLKPDGLFFADIVPKRFSVQSLGNIFNALVVWGYWGINGDWTKGWKKAKANFYPEYYENEISWQEYKKMMEKAGLKSVQVKGNRPFPRLTLPKSLDQLYTCGLKLLAYPWSLFDQHGGPVAKFWGAGWWFWGEKS